MNRKVAERAAIAPFYVMEVMKAATERARAGGNVLHLEVGQPCTPAPSAVIEAAVAALRDDPLGYTDALGSAALRTRISRWYDERYEVAVDPDRIAITSGASGACVLAFLVAFDVGDRVAVASPGYPCYRNMLRAFGVEVVDIEVGSDTRFQLSPELIEQASAKYGRLDGVVVASPSNPCGTMLDDHEQKALVTHCRDRDIRLISDEIYHGITYREPAMTALRHDADAIVVNSFSKYFSMTGWRLGWMVVPEELVVPVERLAQNLTVAPPTLPQLAGIAAFDCTTELDGHVARYARNRDVLLDGLAAAGFERVAESDGAFYLWVDVSHLAVDAAGAAGAADSQRLCAAWLDELGVAVTPGIDFDPEHGHRCVRFSFSGAEPDMVEAMARLVDWAAGRAGGSGMRRP